MAELTTQRKAYDVAIIGGGIAGLSTAHALLSAQPRLKLCVIEAGPHAGRGACWANAGMIHPSQAWPWPQSGAGERSAQIAKDSFLLALRSAALLRENFKTFQIEPRHICQGTMKIFHTAQDEAEQMAKLLPLADLGLKMDFVSGGQLASWPEFAQSKTPLRGAVIFPDEFSGPARIYCQRLMEFITAAGGKIITHAPVASVTSGEIVLADERRIFAAQIVIAAGTGGDALHPALNIKGVKGYSRTWKLPDGVALPRRCIMDHSNHMSIVAIGQHLRICGRSDPADSADEDRHDDMQSHLLALMPQYGSYIENAPAEDWIGIRPMSPQGPIIGAIGPGLWANTAHGHMGWTLSAGAAEKLAALMLG